MAITATSVVVVGFKSSASTRKAIWVVGLARGGLSKLKNTIAAVETGEENGPTSGYYGSIGARARTESIVSHKAVTVVSV